jgi:hypothetical protein
MSIAIRRSILVVVLSLLVVAAGIVVVSQRANAASSTPVVYVATGENFPDALGAGPAAAPGAGPIRWVAQNGIPSETAAELTRLSPDKIIIVGGTAVVSPSVESGLAAYAGSVERIAGSNRYDTAARLSAATFPVASSVGGGDADTLDGKDSTAFATSGHDHDTDYLAVDGKATDADKLDGKDSTAFLTKTSYDSDKDGVVDSAEVKIRYTSESFTVDMASEVPPADKVKCVTSSIAFDGATTVVASGGLSLDPIGTSWASFHGYVHYSKDGGSTWTPLNGVGLRGFPPEAIYPAAVPISAADDLGSGTYNFGIMVYGVNHQAAPGTADYDGQCELTVTAYVGQGATTDIVVD